MFGVSRPTLVGAFMIVTASPAFAADILPDPMPVVQPAPVFGGWYLRGHIGMTNQALDNLDTDLYRDPYIVGHGWNDAGNFDSSPLFGGGIGYQFNEWFRADVTAEYRGKSDFRAVDWVDTTWNNTGLYTNDYSAQKSEWLIMANAYADLGTYGGITPYVGAGIGASRNTISGFRDVNNLMGGAAWASEDSQWNLAWALHAGLGIAVTDRATIDLGYSFVSLGDARTGPLVNDIPAHWNIPNDGFKFNDLTSHDLKVGIRYSFN